MAKRMRLRNTSWWFGNTKVSHAICAGPAGGSFSLGAGSVRMLLFTERAGVVLSGVKGPHRRI